MGNRMATVNFRVPDEGKAEFDRALGEQNKNAVIADLTRKAVAESKLRKRRTEIFRALTQRRSERPALSDSEVRSARAGVSDDCGYGCQCDPQVVAAATPAKSRYRQGKTALGTSHQR